LGLRNDVRYNEAFGLDYDENGPLGLPCTEPRNEALVHGLAYHALSGLETFSDGV